MTTRKHFQKVNDISGGDDSETSQLRQLAVEAKSYISSFSWTPAMSEMYLAYGIAGVVAIFLVEFQTKIQGNDDALWIVVGDLPSAYLVVEPHDDERQALERYCELMEQWVIAVRTGGDMSEVFPIPVQGNAAHADMLDKRIALLRHEIIPLMKS